MYFWEIPIVWVLLCNYPLECMRWSDGSGRHNYFSLIFYLDFIGESTATRSRKTCQDRVPLVPGYVFTRCLGGGSRGSGGKS